VPSTRRHHDGAAGGGCVAAGVVAGPGAGAGAAGAPDATGGAPPGERPAFAGAPAAVSGGASGTGASTGEGIGESTGEGAGEGGDSVSALLACSGAGAGFLRLRKPNMRFFGGGRKAPGLGGVRSGADGATMQEPTARPAPWRAVRSPGGGRAFRRQF